MNPYVVTWTLKPVVREMRLFNGKNDALVTLRGVQFAGRSTSIAAVNLWMETGEYVHDRVHTSDVTTMKITTPGGSEIVRPGDWVLCDLEGNFWRESNASLVAIYDRVIQESS